MRCEECMALAEEYFEGGIDEQSEARVASHLSSCAACEAEHKLMLREQAAYSRFLLDVEPSPALWENLRAGIERERADTARADAHTQGGASRFGRFFAGLFAAPRWATAVSFAAVLVFVALATLAVIRRAGPDQAAAPDKLAANAPRETRTNSGGDAGDGKNNATAPPADAPASATVTTPAPAPPRVGTEEILKASALKGGEREGVRAARRATVAAAASARSSEDESVRAWLREVTRDDARGGGSASAAFVSSSFDASDLSRDSDVSRHAERVEVALRSFLNSNATARRGVDVSYEKRQSRELLLRNVLLRQEARGAGDLPREELLARVEPVLIDIANLPAEASAEDVRQIKEHLRRKGIVSALRLYSTGASARAF